MQVKSPGLTGGSVKVLLAMCTEYETDENVETVIVKKMLRILDQGEKWVFVLDQWVFVLDRWVFVLDQWVLGFRSLFLGLRFRHIPQNTSRTWTYRQQQVSYRSYIGTLTNTTIEGKVQIFHFAKYRFLTSQSTDSPLRKVQIFHFAKYRFSTSQSTDFPLRKVQIFRFLSFRFAKYNKARVIEQRTARECHEP